MRSILPRRPRRETDPFEACGGGSNLPSIHEAADRDARPCSGGLQGHPDGVEAQPADRRRQLDAGEPAPGHPVFSRIDDLKQGAVGEIVGRPKSGPATMTVV
jgi:hypothetical protein